MNKEEELGQVFDWLSIPKNHTGVVEYTNGDKEWFSNGKTHREDGPAFEGVNGEKVWGLNGKCHREDGPAREWPDGRKEWKLDSVLISNNFEVVELKGNYIVVERGIPTTKMFGELKLTKAKLLTATGTMFVYDNLPGSEI